MPRLGLGLGLNLPRPIFLGREPSEPTGFVAKYTSYLVDNFTLVTGDSVNVWADETTKTYGSEEIANGDFSAGATGWAITGGSVSTGELTLNVVSSSFSYAIQARAFTSGTKYMLNARVKGSNSNAGFRVTDNNSGTGGLKGSENRVQLTTDYQDFEFVFTANSNSVQVAIERDSSWGTDFDVIVDSISLKEILTGANDLTQATSSNQPKLVEDYTATQFTASRQPTLIDDAGTWKLDFDSNDFMDGLKPQSGDFTYVLTGVDVPNYDSINSRFIGQQGLSTARFLNLAGSFRINDDADNIVFFEPWNNESVIVVRLSGSTLSVFMDDTQLGADTDVTGSTFTTLTTLGNDVNSFNGSLQSLEIYDVAVADVTNITETPVQTLTADPLKMRTSANLNPTDGQDVAKWYADEFSAYRDARVVFDTNDNMSGLPALTGDWSYMIDTSINTLGTTKYLLEQTAGSSAILALADNYMYLRDTTGANDIALTSYTLTTSRTQFGFVRSGDDLLYYVNGVLKETVDVTGRTFDFGTVGKSATSADMDTKQIIPFNRALTQEEIEYYSYLRSETGDILLPPLLPS